MLLLRQESAAVIFDSTGDPTFNTTAPTGALAGSGWQYEGFWQGSFLGTAIAPQFFVTAKHVGGSVGQSFVFNGSSYLTIGMYDSPGSDLRIWEVDHAFSIYAPLYTSHDEVGKNLVVIGRGTQRGADVTLGGNLKGWSWGAGDGVERWGENQVSGIYNDIGLGSLIYATFDHGAGVNEAHLSSGDSGGGVFIEDGGTWKLAGINYGVDGYFATDSNGSSQFIAALFDTSGYYEQDSPGNWVPVSGPSAFYSTRISTNADWITSVIPEPGTWGALVGVGLAGLAAVDAFRHRKGRTKLTFFAAKRRNCSTDSRGSL